MPKYGKIKILLSLLCQRGGNSVSDQNVLRSSLLLTASGIIAKTIDFVFRAYYSQRLGAEGMGIFSLVFSVHGIMLTFATCGLGTAVSKTVSEQYAMHNYSGIRKAMRLSFSTVFALSFMIILAVYLFSDKIAASFLGEPRCARSLVFLSPSIMFMGISYCIKGYFYASRKVLRPASSEFLEQAVKISVISALLKRWLPLGIERGCEAVFLGLSIGEMSSCLYLLFLYTADISRVECRSAEGRIGAALARIALPITLSSLISSFLRAQEDVWIVSGLCRYGLSRRAALCGYGNIHGMVMPLIVFPLTLLSSFLTLLVPEISRADKMKSRVRLQTLTLRIYRFSAFLGFMIFCVYMTFSEELSRFVYRAPQLAPYLRVLAPLCPIMFTDSISCGILNGLGKQRELLCYSLSDSALRLGMIFFLIPVFGLRSLPLIIICSNIFTCFLTCRRVIKSANVSWEPVSCFVRPALAAALAAFTVRAVYDGLFRVSEYTTLAAGIVFAASVYAAAGIVVGAITKDDVVWLFGRIFA